MGYGVANAYASVLDASQDTVDTSRTYNRPISIPKNLQLTIASGTTQTFSQGLTMRGGKLILGTNAVINVTGETLTLADTIVFGEGASISGTMVIPAGKTFTPLGAAAKLAGTLSIGSGATAAFGSGLMVDGTLTINGTGGTLALGNSAVVNGTLTLNGSQNNRLNVQFADGGGFFVSGSPYTTAGYLYANHAHFYDPTDPALPSWMGIRKENNTGTIQLTNCEVEDAWRAGLFVSSSSVGPTIQVSGCHFHDCDSSGVIIERAHYSSYIRDTEIDNSRWGPGIRLKNTAMSVSGSSSYNIIHANCGGIFAKNFTGSLHRTKVYDNDVVPDTVADNVTFDASSPFTDENVFCFTGTPTGYRRNDLRLVSSSPSVTHNWFYGGGYRRSETEPGENAEIFLTNGSYPSLTLYDEDGYNGTHIYGFDNGGSVQVQVSPPAYEDAVGQAFHAIEWGTSNYAQTIFAPYNWWGEASPTSVEWDAIFDSDDSYIDHSSQLGSPPLPFNPPARISRDERDFAMDHAIFRNGLMAESSNDNATALAAYQRLISDQPSSPLAHNALERIFSTMTKMGIPQNDVESYFAVQAARSDLLSGFALGTAREILRRSMVFYGDLARATAAYRSVAEDENTHSYDRRMAWYNLAWIADERKDKALLAEAVGHVLADTTDDAIAEVAYREWGARVGLTKPSVDAGTTTPSEDAELAAEPNPFNPSTAIRYRVDAAGAVRVDIYAVSGQLIRTLVDETQEPGTHTIVWDGNDASGRSVASGVYLVRLTTPTRAVTHRVTMVR